MSFCLISLGQKLHPEAEKLFPVKAVLASVYLAACWCLFFFYFFNEKGKEIKIMTLFMQYILAFLPFILAKTCPCV